MCECIFFHIIRDELHNFKLLLNHILLTVMYFPKRVISRTVHKDIVILQSVCENDR